MAPLLTALSSGLSAKKILEYLMRKSPELAPRITKALASGLSADKILGFFSKGENFDKLKGTMEEGYSTENNGNPLVQASQIRGQNQANDPASQLQRNVPSAIGAVGALGTGMALTHALPNLLKGSIPERIEKTAGNASQIPPNAQVNAPQAPVSPTIPQNAPQAPPQVNPINVSEILNKYPGVSKKIEDLRKSNNTEAISQYFKQFNPSGTKKIEKEAGMPIEQIVGDYLKQNPAQTVTQASLQKPEANKEISQQTQPEIETPKVEAEAPKIEKGSTVASPQGVGEIKEIRNGKAIIDVNGKKHQVNESELEQEPEEIRSLDLEEPVKEYLSRIPEGEKSSVIDVSLYDDANQELQIRFPNGDQWVYGPIPEEVFEKINSMTGIPVSSGESKLRGTIWDSGVANSAGADFYKLIKKLVKEGKIKERKLKTGIDLFKGFTRVKKRK